MKQDRDPLADLALLAILILWVASFIVFKKTFLQIDPMALNIARFILMTPIALGVLWFVERDLRFPKKVGWLLVGSNVLGHGLYQICFIHALAVGTASSTALLLATLPVFSALFLTIGKVEILTGVQWAGILVALGGVTAYVAFGPGNHGALGFGVGELMALCSAASFALYGILNKGLMRSISPLRLMAFGIPIGLITMLPFGISNLVQQNWLSVTPTGWAGVGFATLFPVYVAYLLWNWAIARQGVARTVLVSYLVPIATGFASFFLLDERLTTIQIFSGVIVLAGVALVRISRSIPVTRQPVSTPP